MTSKNWIYDPPPPPPKKAVTENIKTYNSQRPVNGRDNFRGNTRQQQYSGSGRPNYSRQANGPQGNRPRFMQPSPVYPQTGYQQPVQVPTLQPQFVGYPPQFPHPYPLQHHSFPIQQYYPCPPQQYPQQFVPPGPHLQYPPLPVYQTQNNYGYTLSSTAFSLPDHHSQPQPSERPDLSEDEVRHALEQQAGKPSLPIEGTNIRLNTVEDIMAWRQERKKKWLSKIAPAAGPNRKRKRKGIAPSQPATSKVETLNLVAEESDVSEDLPDESEDERNEGETKKKKEIGEEESEGGLSEGEVFVPQRISKKRRKRAGKSEINEGGVISNDRSASESPEKTAPLKVNDGKYKEAKKKGLCRNWLRGKCSRGKKCRYNHKVKEKVKPVDNPLEVKPRSFYAALLQSQMERENIVLLQTLLHFRDHGLLDLK